MIFGTIGQIVMWVTATRLRKWLVIGGVLAALFGAWTFVQRWDAAGSAEQRLLDKAREKNDAAIDAARNARHDAMRAKPDDDGVLPDDGYRRD